MTLCLERIVKSYQSGHRVVNDVSLTVNPGEVVGLLGTSGAGKTSLFLIAAGFLRPDSGSVSLEGQAVTDLPTHARARLGLTYLPQDPSVLARLSVEDNLRLVAQVRSLPRAQAADRIERLLQQLDLVALRARLAGVLSGGERRRLELARCLVVPPRFLLLDEPFTGIDAMAVTEIQRIIRALRDQGPGILVTDRNLPETLAIVDRAMILSDGRIVAEGDPDQIGTRYAGGVG